MPGCFVSVLPMWHVLITLSSAFINLPHTFTPINVPADGPKISVKAKSDV